MLVADNEVRHGRARRRVHFIRKDLDLDRLDDKALASRLKEFRARQRARRLQQQQSDSASS